MVLEPSYLAGVIDSDGSISIIKRNRQSTTQGYHYRELVQITWVDSQIAREVFNAIKDMFGGSVFMTTKKANEYSGKRPIVKYTAEAKAAARLLTAVLPYLKLKKLQAQKALEMRKLKSNTWGNRNPKPQSVWLLEDTIYESMLKQRARGIA